MFKNLSHQYQAHHSVRPWFILRQRATASLVAEHRIASIRAQEK